MVGNQPQSYIFLPWYFISYSYNHTNGPVGNHLLVICQLVELLKRKDCGCRLIQLNKFGNGLITGFFFSNKSSIETSGGGLRKVSSPCFYWINCRGKKRTAKHYICLKLVEIIRSLTFVSNTKASPFESCNTSTISATPQNTYRCPAMRRQRFERKFL